MSNPEPGTPNSAPRPPQTIGVIVGRDLIGDALIKLPFLRALRNAFPHAEINWITSQGPTAFATLLRKETSSLIDRIHEQPPWLAAVAHPEASAPPPFFDLLIDTRNRWREALYARKIPHRLFIASAMRFLFSEKRPSFLSARPSRLCDQLLQLVELAAGYMPPSTGALPVEDALLQKARRILPQGKIYIGLAPGCGSLVRAWPRYKFEKVAFTQAQKGRVPVFILGPQELSWYDELRATVPTAIFPLQDYDVWGSYVVTLDHTLAVGRLLDVAVANDSGVSHILAAADCPMISLFGPTRAAKAAPRVTHGIAVSAQDFGSSHMRAIPPEAVNEAIENMLAAKSG